MKHSWPIAGFAPVQANSSRSPREASSNKFEWREWLARASFGALLAGLAIAATFAGGFMFAIFIAVVAFAAAREWHRMVSGPRYASTIAVTTIAVAASLGWAVVARDSQWPVWLLLLGGVLAAICAFASGTRPLSNGFGTLYVGLPALSLVVLRIHVPHGAAAVLVLFIAIWAADSAALILGRFLGGPKLVPALSPNKTWAGFIAGTLFASAAVAFCIKLLGGSLWQAALLGLALALAGHCGDLFESWVKRRAGRKNSGGLIPGHGGVLDRVDSTLFAAPLAALLVFVFGLDLLCGGHP